MRRRNTQNCAELVNSHIYEPRFHLCEPISVVEYVDEQATIKKRVAQSDGVAVEIVKSYKVTHNSVEATFDEQENNCFESDALKILEKDGNAMSQNDVYPAPERLQNNLSNIRGASKISQSDSGCSVSVSSSEPSISCRITRSRTKKRESETHVESVTKLIDGNFKYVHEDNGKRNKIFVFEGSREFGRIYNYSFGMWYCNGCYLTNGQRVCGSFKKGVFHHPSLHLCEPITVKQFEKDQQRIQKKHNLASPKVKPTNESLMEIHSNETSEASNVATSSKSDYSEQLSTSIMSVDVPVRIVDILNFEYAFNEVAQIRKRFTVYEINRSFVRQYKVEENEKWYCINCKTGYVKKNDDTAEIFGAHQCEPIPASEYRKRDKLQREKYNALKKAENVILTGSPSSTSNNIESLRQLNFYEWEYKTNDRSVIIVYENYSKHLIREYKYDKDSQQYVCIGCFNATPSTPCIGKRNDDDFSIMVPTSENHICSPHLKEEDNSKNNGCKKRGRIDDKEDESSAIKKARNSATVGCEESEYDSAANRRDILTSPEKPSPLISNAQNASVSPCASSNLVEFHYPSGKALVDFCMKLKLPYSCDAVMFWSRSAITHVAHDSVPGECFSVVEETASAFRCFSVMFTGTEENFLELKTTLLPYLCSNIRFIGDKYGLNLTQTDTPLFTEHVLGNEASEVHFEALSAFLECRIGIFENNQWKRYGDWSEINAQNHNICTFLLQKVGSKYSIVLSFN
uniref:Uncharacterized protein n=1 Tax=Panagrolaimus superbus TaxID=310955 RepID=A0A914Z5M2_9BILA